MKDITLKITGRQFIGDEDEDSVEFVTDAKMSLRNGALYLMYDESEFSGYPGCRTVLKLSGQVLKMKRIGAEAGPGVEMIFDEGKRISNRYHTPFGAFDLEVLTRRVAVDLDEECRGKISVDYHIALGELAQGRNTIDIDVMA